MTEMRRSWLVQRLEKPRDQRSTIWGKDNPFAFGGGLVNGGLSSDAMDLLRPVFGFDYMGSADFEWGAVPKALTRIAQYAAAGTLIASTFEIALADVAKGWQEPKGAATPTGTALIYLLCNASHDEAEARIRGWAKEPYGSLKEVTYLSDVLRPSGKYERRTAGWLELDNGFFFFTDKTMWSHTAAIFGLDVAAEVTA